MTSLKNRINQAAQSVLDGKGIIRNAILAKDVVVPENPTFQQLADSIGDIPEGTKVDTGQVYAIDRQTLLYGDLSGGTSNYGTGKFQVSNKTILYFTVAAALYRFDKIQNVLSKVGNIPNGSAKNPSIAYDETNGILWITGGANGTAGGYYTDCRKYNISTNTFTTVSPMLGVRQDHQTIYIDGKVYVFTGSNTSQSKTMGCEKYEVSTDTWTSITSGFSSSCKSVLPIDEGKLMTFFTRVHFQYTHERTCFYTYDMNADVWTYMGDCPFTNVYLSGRNGVKLYYFAAPDVANNPLYWCIYDYSTHKYELRLQENVYLVSTASALEFDDDKVIIWSLPRADTANPAWRVRYDVRDLSYDWRVGSDNKKYSKIDTFTGATIKEVSNLDLVVGNVLNSIPYPVDDTNPFRLVVQLPSEYTKAIV